MRSIYKPETKTRSTRRFIGWDELSYIRYIWKLEARIEKLLGVRRLCWKRVAGGYIYTQRTEENPAEPEYPDDIEDWDDEDLEE
jgi:hypothetical protein